MQESRCETSLPLVPLPTYLEHLFLVIYHTLPVLSLCSDTVSCAVDPNYVENSAGAPELLVAIEPKSQLVVSMEMDSKLPMEMYERVAQLAIDGSNLIYRVLANEVRDYTLQLYQSRSGIGSSSN